MTLSAAFTQQAQACAGLGSPFMARLCTLLAAHADDDTPVFAKLRRWSGDIGPAGHSLPLRLAGALHALVVEGADTGLVQAYPPNDASDQDIWHAVQTAFHVHGPRILEWLDLPPQTNEVRRSTCLIAAGRWLAARHGLPIRLSEMGASAGLNLFWDKMCLRLPNGHYGPQASPLVLRPEWTGPPPANVAPEITERCGVDLNPLDFHDPADCLRLRAYLWPDQPQRRHLTDAAIDIARATGADMHKGDAADWLAARLAAPRAATLHLIYTTIAFQYFPAATQARISREIAAAGQASTPDTPIAWLGMEADGQGKGAAISLRIWPGDETLSLGRIDYHGRWIRWAPPEP